MEANCQTEILISEFREINYEKWLTNELTEHSVEVTSLYVFT